MHTQTRVTAADVAKLHSHKDVCDFLKENSNQDRNTELSRVRFYEAES